MHLAIANARGAKCWKTFYKGAVHAFAKLQSVGALYSPNKPPVPGFKETKVHVKSFMGAM